MRDASLPVPTTCIDALTYLLPRRGAQRREERSGRPRWRARWPTRHTRARAAARHAVPSQVHTVRRWRCRACVAKQGRGARVRMRVLLPIDACPHISSPRTKGVGEGGTSVSKSVVARFAASHVFSSLLRGVHLDAEMCKG